jgi:hypothetical protein
VVVRTLAGDSGAAGATATGLPESGRKAGAVVDMRLVLSFYYLQIFTLEPKDCFVNIILF